MSNSLLMMVSSHRPDGPAAAGADHVTMLIKKDVVVNHEEALSLDELVERSGLQRDRITGARGAVVAPRLDGVYRALGAHPIICRCASAHQQDLDRRRGDESAIASPPRVFLIEIEWM